MEKKSNIWRRSGAIVEKIVDGCERPSVKYVNKLVLKKKQDGED